MREIITVQVGETIADGDFVHIDTDGEAYKAILPNRPACGYCVTGASSGSIQVFFDGKFSAPVEGLSGTFIYLDNSSAGLVTETRPNAPFQTVGRLADVGSFVIDIQTPSVPHTFSTSPSISTGTGAGTGASATISGNNYSGVLSITAGTGAAANATVATITFSPSFDVAPKAVLISAANGAATLIMYASGTGRLWHAADSNLTANGFTISSGGSGNTAINGTEYRFFYHIIL